MGFPKQDFQRCAVRKHKESLDGSGSKLPGTQKTLLAMGKYIYITPNLRSLQRGFFLTHGQMAAAILRRSFFAGKHCSHVEGLDVQEGRALIRIGRLGCC